ncbi:MAG: hypothetical protein IPL65_10705 [Lewinellaceae bacterium]|nr:hypothetical protein [Lewinellaceae bacterium]
MIINFSNERVRAETATSLFGAPNHPTEEGGWILSVKDDYNLIAWAFDNKLVIAANIPGSEWDNDPMFSTPSGYAPPVEEQPTTKPAPSAWTNMQKEISQMVFQMELEAGAGDFKTARGEALDNDPDQGYFKCILVPPLAEEALVVRYDDSHWLVNNTMYSALSLQEALQYEKELGAQLPALFSAEVSLVPADTKELFGSTVQLWDVLDKKGTRMAIQVGTTHYEWNVENSYNVALLLIQE